MMLRAPSLRRLSVLLVALPLMIGAAQAPSVSVAAAGDSSQIGTSVQGRSIDVGCLGTGAQTLLIVGGLHTGPEAHSSELVLELARLGWGGGLEVPVGTRLCLIPSLNPDGQARGTRVNANGVDLNRNWPAFDWTADAYHPESGVVSGGSAPLSEPETRALWDYVLRTRPAMVAVLHCCGGVVEANDGLRADEFAATYAAAAGMQPIGRWTAYPVTGQFIDAMDRIGISAMDIEMTSFNDIALDQHRVGVDRLLATFAVSSPREPSIAAAPADSAWTTYLVRSGDTLADIAGRHGTSAAVLATANRIARPELIEVGAVLTVPR